MKRGRPTDFINLWSTPFLSFLFLLYSIYVLELTPNACLVILLICLGWTVHAFSSWVRGPMEFSYGVRVYYAIFNRKGKRSRMFLLFCLVKLFWLPLMIEFSLGNGYAIKDSFDQLLNTILSGNEWNVVWSRTYHLLLPILFFLDTFIYALGYCFESRSLNNKLRSVDATLLGWFVALICYPPLHQKFTQLVRWHSNDFPHFENPFVELAIQIIMLLLLCMYAYASISLGWKASNMTNRGVVSKGAYGIVRHPAYAAKSMFWLLGSLPFLNRDPGLIFTALFWMSIYMLRAFTEERHLLQDKEYRAYVKKVRYRFIPRIF